MGEKSGNIAIIYGAIALLSVMLLIGYLLWEKKKEKTFLALFACVSLANCGYFLQALSDTLTGAMMANRLSYLGSAFSVLVMLVIIMDACLVERTKGKMAVLIGISTAVFLLAASGDWLGLYYRSVSLETVNGMTRLVKDYGPLHTFYPLYLIGYLITMVVTIVRSSRKGNLSSSKFAGFLVAVVLTNLIVWAVEQFVDVDFEFLSVSYIATEVMLLAIYSMLRDYGILQPGGVMVSAEKLTQQNEIHPSGELPLDLEERFDAFSRRVTTLSSAERRIFNYYMQGCEIADIPSLAYISINTVKKHNRSIYQKLDVASRDELMVYIEQFRLCGRLDELTGDTVEAD